MAQTIKNMPIMEETRVGSLGQKIPWRREWLPTPVFLPREFHRQRSLVGTVCEVARVRHDLAAKPSPQNLQVSFLLRDIYSDQIDIGHGVTENTTHQFSSVS